MDLETFKVGQVFLEVVVLAKGLVEATQVLDNTDPLLRPKIHMALIEMNLLKLK